MKKFAFTLSELLIVLVIIGVISALALPSLSTSTNDKERVVRVKKIYGTLSEAHNRAVSVYGPVIKWFDSTDLKVATRRYGERTIDGFKIKRECKMVANGACQLTVPTYLDGNTATNLNTNEYYKIVLADGISLFFNISDTTCDTDKSDGTSSGKLLSKVCGTIDVDIDGPSKGKSVWGKDMFRFYITRKGILPDGLEIANDTKDDSGLKSNCFTKGQSCAGWVTTTENLDYLKSTEGVCPNGVALSWTNTSCSN